MEESLDATVEFSRQFTDNPALQFQSLTPEEFRTYEFPGGAEVTINAPIALAVTVASVKPEVGSPHAHRIVDVVGQSHYVPAGWLQIRWKAKVGEKAFSF